VPPVSTLVQKFHQSPQALNVVQLTRHDATVNKLSQSAVESPMARITKTTNTRVNAQALHIESDSAINPQSTDAEPVSQVRVLVIVTIALHVSYVRLMNLAPNIYGSNVQANTMVMMAGGFMWNAQDSTFYQLEEMVLAVVLLRGIPNLLLIWI
jgi:ABC-type hemin transport system substrate-binding protein